MGRMASPLKPAMAVFLRLEDLIELGITKARERLNEAGAAADFPAEEREDIAMKVAVAAIKFADLQNNRIADYVFDLDRMTSFEGKTGPYLLYQAVRIKSLLAKAEYVHGGEILVTDADRALYLLLTEFPEVIEQAVKYYTPHVLCDHAYKLAQAFSSFYGNTHILSEENTVQRQSWLTLSAMVLAQLELLLDLVGIKIPARM